MGLLIIIILIAFLIALIIETRTNKDRSAYLFMIIPIIMLIISITFFADVKPKFERFKRTYEIVNNVNFNNLTIESKKSIIDDIIYINNTIDYANKHANSFWLGLYTSEEYLKYDKIDINYNINLNKNE